MDVEKLEIKDVNKENVEDLIYLCVPPDKKMIRFSSGV